MSNTKNRVFGPVAATRSENMVFVPARMDNVELVDGMWAQWQRANATTSLEHAIDWVEREGTADNFRRLAPSAQGRPDWRGLWFNDSNLYKTLESAAWDVAREPSRYAKTDSLIQKYGQIVADAQQQDGYINTFVQAGYDVRWEDLVKSHELFCIGHLIQAGIAHRRAVGDSVLFDTARKAADVVVRDFGELRRRDNDGHEEVEIALVELYRETKDESYLRLAKQFVDLRGTGSVGEGGGHFDSTYFQDAVPVRKQTTVVGHAVRAVFLMIAMADLYLETGEEALRDAVLRQWESMTSSKTYLTGALGSRIADEAFGDPYELPADLAYGETCATVANIMLSMRLLLITGESRFADAIERGLYNLIAASTGLDRRSFFYSNPAHRRSKHPAAVTGEASKRAEAPGTRPEWFATSCCPSNVMRLIATLGTYAATSNDDGIQIHQFMPSRIGFDLPAGRSALSVATGYPYDGQVRVRIDEAPGSAWTLSIRIPHWAASFSVSVNDEPVHAAENANGYLDLTSEWKPGDVVLLRLDMAPRLTAMHPSVDAMRGTLAIERGPLVYALESSDQSPDINLDQVEISPHTSFNEQKVAILDHASIGLVFDGRLRDDDVLSSTAWGAADTVAATTATPIRLTAIPYYLWANRGPSTMRIHLPVASSSLDAERDNIPS